MKQPEDPPELPRVQPPKDAQRLPEPERAAQAAHAARPALGRRRPGHGGHVYLLVGPVGAGKSTFALELTRDHGAVRLTLDEWMALLFRPDRPDDGIVEWYVERAARAVEQIARVATAIVDAGVDVVLEIGLLQRREREDFYRRIEGASVGLTLYVVDAARDVRRERVEKRNHARGPTFSMFVPPAVFELASDRWEPPEDDECEGRDVRFVSSLSPPVERLP